jgi:hypothetical protein
MAKKMQKLASTDVVNEMMLPTYASIDASTNPSQFI